MPGRRIVQSALARAGDSDGSPPVDEALPSESNVAVWKNLVVVILPVAVNLPALGSYAQRRQIVVADPASDEHLGVAQQRLRVVVPFRGLLPVAVNVPALGSYSSALAAPPRVLVADDEHLSVGQQRRACPSLPMVILRWR